MVTPQLTRNAKLTGFELCSHNPHIDQVTKGTRRLFAEKLLESILCCPVVQAPEGIHFMLQKRTCQHNNLPEDM
jgi:hypothetical protein